MAYSTFNDVDEVLNFGSATLLNAGSAEIKFCIGDADALIDARAGLYNLSFSSGTSVALVTDASKYWAACFYVRNYKIKKEEDTHKPDMWWDHGSTALWSYIREQTDDSDYSGGLVMQRQRRMWSTTMKDPSS